MIPRIGLDLEPGLQLQRLLPGTDLLDIAYGAAHGGAEVILIPVTMFVTSESYSVGMFDRPGLPLLAVKTEMQDLDRIPSLGSVPDRIVVFGDRGRPIVDVAEAAQAVMQAVGVGQEVGILVQPEATALKELSKARVQWAYLPTETMFNAASVEEAQAESARLASTAVAATRIGMRIALWGPTGRHLPAAFCAIPTIEELYPSPDLWPMALRLGWERAVSEYRLLMR